MASDRQFLCAHGCQLSSRLSAKSLTLVLSVIAIFRQLALSVSSACAKLQSPSITERWAQIGITIEFLIVVRTLGEFFRLRHVHATDFSTAVAALYVGGALIATCSCWMAVSFYFFRRYALSACIALLTVPILVVYKIAVIGW